MASLTLEPVTMALAGGGAVDPLVQDIGICLLVSGVLSVVFQRIKLPTIAALLVAGVVIGPVGLSVVTDKDRIETIAHLGLTLLLFVIGLEVNLRGLLASGRTILLSGALQVPLTVGLGWLAFKGAAFAGIVSDPSSKYLVLYLALACGFSSTLLVVKAFQERRLLDSPSGRLGIAMLIFQDIWAIVILAVQPNFADPDVKPVLATFGGMVLIAGVAAAAARWVLPAAFRIVARRPELVVSVALAWAFGLGLLGSNLGRVLGAAGVPVDPSISLEMAALIAGTSIASLPYSHEVVTKVTNLRDFFVTLFFVALGMEIPVPTIATFGGAVLLSAIAILLRFVVFLPLFYKTGTDRRTAVITSTRLAQVSEFCLVIAYLGKSLGHITASVVATVIFAFVLTALITPSLFTTADTLDSRVGPLLDRIGSGAPAAAGRDSPSNAAGPRIVLLGFHRLASSLLHDIEKRRPPRGPARKVSVLNTAHHDKLPARGG
jgi:Kef-type K+ transport system membrane component KefB